MAKQITTEDFIKRSNETHTSKYTYTKTIYVKSIEKVIITCPEHGDFEQTPQMHLRGSGCNKCGAIQGGQTNRKDLRELLEECHSMHNNKYKYNFANYTSINKKYEIVCPEHGVFLQRLSSHLSGVGCKKCVDALKTKTTEEFIKDAKAVHGEKFDYSQVHYLNSHSKIQVICPKHGVFSIAPYGHLDGRGCAQCAIASRIAALRTSENSFSKSGYKAIAKGRECTFYILKCFNDVEQFYKVRNYCIHSEETLSF
jgi:hypothetical protein